MITALTVDNELRLLEQAAQELADQATAVAAYAQRTRAIINGGTSLDRLRLPTCAADMGALAGTVIRRAGKVDLVIELAYHEGERLRDGGAT